MKYTPEVVMDALHTGHIIPYFQPQYDATTGFMTGAEILARWINEDDELINPDDFIPVIEQSGDIVELDWYMAEQACQALAELKDLHIPISVNFSRMHASNKDFTNRLTNLLKSYDVPTELLHIEITETAIFLSGNEVTDWANEIHDAGFIIALDDFCSGLSNVCEVTKLPIDILKFDKSLFYNINSSKTRIVLEALFYCANRLDLDTVAEGIEDNEQLKFIQTCNCNKVQGFLFDTPMPKDEFLYLACGFKNRHATNLDALDVQTYSSVGHLLLQAIYKEYPMIIMGNLSKNSYYMVSHEDFTSTVCPSAGTFDELIDHGYATMHPDDKELFRNTFSRESLLNEYNKGAKTVSIVVKQLGDDGVYRDVCITDHFVKNPSKNDILVISFNKNI
ncbi:MAG: EAL domain-containing protein [Pseudobutyrivibrio sp.]|nr:EAL domain-containing protein [Pseudobutyrivibrio sp.]